MILLARMARDGMLYQTPVFDGAQWETDIKPLLKSLGLPSTGTFMFVMVERANILISQ